MRNPGAREEAQDGNVQRRYRLSLRVLRVGYGIPHNLFQERLHAPAGIIVDQLRDTLDATAAGEATDGGLRDTLDSFNVRCLNVEHPRT